MAYCALLTQAKSSFSFNMSYFTDTTAKMFRDMTSSDLDDLSYRCPKCSRSFGTLKKLRDHLDISHLYQPTRDTDEENITGNYRLSHKPASKLTKESLELERQLQRAKEIELRHKILNRHTKSKDELKALNSEITNARQRQQEMCNIIHGTREQVEMLRQSAEKVTADQHSLIQKLREELVMKDTQLERSMSELRRLADSRLTQDDQLVQLSEERSKHEQIAGELKREMVMREQAAALERDRHRQLLEQLQREVASREAKLTGDTTDRQKTLSKLQRDVKDKEKVVSDKEKEISVLKEFISEATQKEMTARQKMETFINSLLDRAELAEDEVKKLQHRAFGRTYDPARKSVSDDNITQRGDLRPGSSGSLYKHRPPSAETVMSQVYPRHTIPPPGGVPLGGPQGFPPLSPAATPQLYHAQAPWDPPLQQASTYGPPGEDGGIYGVKGKQRKGQGRPDGERPESGYSSLKHGHSRTHSRLSSVSEASQASTATVVPVYEQEALRAQGIVFPDDPDITSDVTDSEPETLTELQTDDHGILWDDNSVFDSVSLPSTKHSSLQRPAPAAPLVMSRLSSINSTDKAIMKRINKDTKREMQRHKFILRDRLRMLKEQEKLFRKDGRSSDDLGSDSDLTSVTDDDSLGSLSVSSEDELVTVATRGPAPRATRGGYHNGVLQPIERHISRGNLNAALPPVGGSAPRVHPPVSRQAPGVTVATPQAPDVSAVISAYVAQRRAVLFLIFSYLDTATLSQMALVCREWRDVSRHPSLWRRVCLSRGRITAKYLKTLSKWCTELQVLTLEGLRARPKRSHETFDDYKKATRGILEEGIEAMFKASPNTVTSIRIVDCGNILTDRCLWLASCSCRHLRRVAYISDTDPVGPEVMWSLGAGCREITTLIVPPLHPNERAERFTNRCVQMISWCWPDLNILSVGGKHINVKGLVALARNCSLLRVLELHQMSDVTEEIAMAMCQAGLRNLETIDITFTPVEPGAIKHFASSCPRLKSFKLKIGITDYFSDVDKPSNKKSFDHKMKKLQDLKKDSTTAGVLTIMTDSK